MITLTFIRLSLTLLARDITENICEGPLSLVHMNLLVLLELLHGFRWTLANSAMH